MYFIIYIKNIINIPGINSFFYFIFYTRYTEDTYVQHDTTCTFKVHTVYIHTCIPLDIPQVGTFFLKKLHNDPEMLSIFSLSVLLLQYMFWRRSLAAIFVKIFAVGKVKDSSGRRRRW